MIGTVAFFVDPEIVNDPSPDGIRTSTLSDTFFADALASISPETVTGSAPAEPPITSVN